MEDLDYMREYRRWISHPRVGNELKRELDAIRGNDGEIKARFGGFLEFGTAGIRGEMGAGTLRMNIYTVRHATEGLARLILREAGAAEKGVAIACDSRLMSHEFAREAAAVLARHNIRVLLFDGIRPTPELSFAVRAYSAAAGINITASHNPKQYNGYKAYGADGVQLPPELAEIVTAESAAVNPLEVETADFDEAVRRGVIRMIGKETDEKYLEKVLEQVINPDAVKKAELKVVYTPFHGSGYRLVPEAARRIGCKLYMVDAQAEPDGEFPTVKSPNPEDAEGFTLAVELAERVGAGLIIGTDPDADRVGVLVRDGGGFTPLTGNQLGALLLNYSIKERRRIGRLENAYAVKSIVSTELAADICARAGVTLFDVLTGFKYIGETMNECEEKGMDFILGFEESSGFLTGTYARDKDAVLASVLIIEMASHYALAGMSLADALNRLYAEYGVYREEVLNITMDGLDGLLRRGKIMEGLRGMPPETLGMIPVVGIRDYLGCIIRRGGSVSPSGLPASDVLYYELADGSAAIVRPSGTEPKIKVYFKIKSASATECGAKLAALRKDFARLMK